VALCDIWDYHLNEGRLPRQERQPGERLRNYEDCLRKKRTFSGHRRDAGFLPCADDQHLPESRPACVLRKDDEQHHRWSALHVETMPQPESCCRSPSAAQQPALPFTLNRLLHEAQFCGRLTAAQVNGTAPSRKTSAGPRNTRCPRVRWQNTATRTCTSSAIGAGTRDSAAAVVRSRRASDRHIQLVDGYAESVIGSGGLDYYKNHDWYDNAIVIYEYPMARA